MQVDYTPANLGADSGALVVTTTNDPDEGTVSVSMSGTGVGVCNLVAPASVAFGSVTVGTTANMSALFQNTGTAACTVSGLTVSGTGFALGTRAPALPATSRSRHPECPVRYSPTAAGASTGSLRVPATIRRRSPPPP